MSQRWQNRSFGKSGKAKPFRHSLDVLRSPVRKPKLELELPATAYRPLAGQLRFAGVERCPVERRPEDWTSDIIVLLQRRARPVGLITHDIAESSCSPLMKNAPVAALVLRAAVIVYLVYLARMLWHYRSSGKRDPAAASFKSVLVTTLLNPKALVLALVLLPQHRSVSELLPWIVAMAVLIAAIGLAWIAMGTVLERGLRKTGQGPDLMYRLSAVVLVVMATAMGAQTLA